jgi:hypothetical protein
MGTGKGTGHPEIEGEGSRSADRHYREATERFVESGRVEEAAEEAKRAVNEDPGPLEEAERIGRSRMAEEDPAFDRDR